MLASPSLTPKMIAQAVKQILSDSTCQHPHGQQYVLIQKPVQKFSLYPTDIFFPYSGQNVQGTSRTMDECLMPKAGPSNPAQLHGDVPAASLWLFLGSMCWMWNHWWSNQIFRQQTRALRGLPDRAQWFHVDGKGPRDRTGGRPGPELGFVAEELLTHQDTGNTSAVGTLGSEHDLTPEDASKKAPLFEPLFVLGFSLLWVDLVEQGQNGTSMNNKGCEHELKSTPVNESRSPES
ncbi:hypothetical protein DV515_00002507 [Chloebia gouldiae]|uniref:Uncharacterized protein n=1 Tax=Chloebia gouldiae TaxID=44316 RepID=A0A3L8SWR5_CHLGU|nr:hypothetical protein DV515_00002507 [Chloebia gouldiae]